MDRGAGSNSNSAPVRVLLDAQYGTNCPVPVSRLLYEQLYLPSSYLNATSSMAGLSLLLSSSTHLPNLPLPMQGPPPHPSDIDILYHGLSRSGAGWPPICSCD